MAAVINLPVHMRIGSGDEFHLGDFTVDVNGDGTLQYGRPKLAEMLRAAADEIENPTVDEQEVPDAPARH